MATTVEYRRDAEAEAQRIAAIRDALRVYQRAKLFRKLGMTLGLAVWIVREVAPPASIGASALVGLCCLSMYASVFTFTVEWSARRQCLEFWE